MPNTDFKYEEFEGLLGSFYISLLPLKLTKDKKDTELFNEAYEILTGFSDRHNVQRPEQAFRKPRTLEVSVAANMIRTCRGLTDLTNSFWRDFALATPYRNTDEELAKKDGYEVRSGSKGKGKLLFACKCWWDSYESVPAARNSCIEYATKKNNITSLMHEYNDVDYDLLNQQKGK